MASRKDEFNLDEYKSDVSTENLFKELEGSTTTYKSKSGFFPVKNGAVKVSYPITVQGKKEIFTHTFKIQPKVYINDVLFNKDGEMFATFGGQDFNYLLTNIPEKTSRESWRIRRELFVRYLLELEEAIEKKEELVKTIFGFKAIDYMTDRVEEAVDLDNIEANFNLNV